MGKTLDDVVTNFQSTGNCEIDVDLVVNKWNHTWWIAQWKDTYRLIKFLRMGTASTRIKVGISEQQAKELIEKLNLDSEGGGFTSATTWRQSEEYWVKLRALNSKKKDASTLLPLLDKIEWKARSKSH